MSHDQRPADHRQTLSERYGQRSPVAKRAGIVAIIVGCAALVGWGAWAAWENSQPTVTGIVHSYDVKSPHAVQVTLDINRPGTAPAHCTVSALASDHSTVGVKVVTLPAGRSGEHSVVETVRTEREATTATIEHCR